MHANRFLKTASQVHNGHVWHWYTERHASQLAVQLWDHFTDGLGSAGRRWNDVGSGRAATAPVLG